MEETQKEKQAVPEPIDIITLLHDVLRGVKKLWWACLLLTVLCTASSWYTAKHAYRPLYRAAASFTVATGSGESGGFSYGFYYNTATASQLARTFPYILESELLTDGIKQALGTDYITASLSASAVEDSNLFTLTATGGTQVIAGLDVKPGQTIDHTGTASVTYYKTRSVYLERNTVDLSWDVGVYTVNTGDTNNAMMWAGIASMSLAALVVLWYVLERRKYTKEG